MEKAPVEKYQQAISDDSYETTHILNQVLKCYEIDPDNSILFFKVNIDFTKINSPIFVQNDVFDIEKLEIVRVRQRLRVKGFC